MFEISTIPADAASPLYSSSKPSKWVATSSKDSLASILVSEEQFLYYLLVYLHSTAIVYIDILKDGWINNAFVSSTHTIPPLCLQARLRLKNFVRNRELLKWASQNPPVLLLSVKGKDTAAFSIAYWSMIKYLFITTSALMSLFKKKKHKILS